MHPYRRVDYERTPARPAAGQNTHLGVKVVAEEPVERVWVDFRTGREGAPERIEAAQMAEEGTASYWSATLPSLPAGETCQYQFVAESSAGQAASEVYRFDVLASLSLKAIAGDVDLKGDPEHAGIQYRPSDELDRGQTLHVAASTFRGNRSCSV